MSLELCILASGSLGNCAVLRTPAGVMLIDAGLGPRVTSQRLGGTGVAVPDVRAICLTHLDSDHFKPSWLATIVDRGVRVFCHASRVEDLIRYVSQSSTSPSRVGRLRPLLHGFGDDAFEALPGVTLRSLPLPHDRCGSHGFVAEGFGCRIGYATDLGRVPRHLIEQFEALDVLALESNYDPRMQRESQRPWFLKQRIMDGSGHLSNEQAFDAIRQILDRCQRGGRPLPDHIVLLHRSRECNCPQLVSRLFGRDARIAGRLTLAEQFERSAWLRPRGASGQRRSFVGEQLQLAWG